MFSFDTNDVSEIVHFINILFSEFKVKQLYVVRNVEKYRYEVRYEVEK